MLSCTFVLKRLANFLLTACLDCLCKRAPQHEHCLPLSKCLVGRYNPRVEADYNLRMCTAACSALGLLSGAKAAMDLIILRHGLPGIRQTAWPPLVKAHYEASLPQKAIRLTPTHLIAVLCSAWWSKTSDKGKPLQHTCTKFKCHLWHRRTRNYIKILQKKTRVQRFGLLGTRP